MNLYSKRREKVFKDLKDHSALLLFSGEALMKSEDEAYSFDVNRNFYYLTGLEKENMALLMYKNNNQLQEILFILPYDELLARWVGGRMSKEEVSEVAGLDKVMDYDTLDSQVARIINAMRFDNNFTFYFDFWHYNMNQLDTPASKYAKKLLERYPNIIVKDIYPILTSLRMIKDEYEVTCIKQAIHTTRIGIDQMMKQIRPGLNEMVMEGVFDFVLKQNMCRDKAFNTIAASGPRATILHYNDNNQVMNDGELFLCDLGATFKHYCADISRTFPVNGKFTPRQKELYELVLNAQELVRKNAKVGVKLSDLNQLVINYYKEELPKHGLNKDVSEYYFHSCSHHLGLDTHDVEYERGSTLVAGNVITNEPGLYIADEGIGIRIEDDLLITGTEAEVLSNEILKTVDEIEVFMADK